MLFFTGLGLTDDEAPQFADFDSMREKFAKIFASKTQVEWCEVFDNEDACVTPVLTLDEAGHYPHNKGRNAFMFNKDGQCEPSPAPQLSRSPGHQTVAPQPAIGQHTYDVLKQIGYTQKDIKELDGLGVIAQSSLSKL